MILKVWPSCRWTLVNLIKTILNDEQLIKFIEDSGIDFFFKFMSKILFNFFPVVVTDPLEVFRDLAFIWRHLEIKMFFWMLLEIFMMIWILLEIFMVISTQSNLLYSQQIWRPRSFGSCCALRWSTIVRTKSTYKWSCW